MALPAIVTERPVGVQSLVYPPEQQHLTRTRDSSTSFRETMSEENQPLITQHAPKPRFAAANHAVPLRNGRIPSSRGDWRLQAEIKLAMYDLPTDLTTRAVWEVFSKEGELSSIEFFVDDEGNRRNRGCIRFCPPPKRDFWSHGRYEAKFPGLEGAVSKIKLGLETNIQLNQYQGKSGRSYPQKLLLEASSLSFGFMYKPEEMKVMFTSNPISEIPVILQQDLRFRQIEISFPVEQSGGIAHHYKLCLSHASPLKVWELPLTEPSKSTFVIWSENPPTFWVKHSDKGSHQSVARTWSKNQAWNRKTGVHKGPISADSGPTSLSKDHSIINVGRWTAYKLEFDFSKTDKLSYDLFCNALCDFNIDILNRPGFSFNSLPVQPVWNYIDDQASPHSEEPLSLLAQLMDENAVYLPFEVRYQLEVCISEGHLNEYNLSRQFVAQLNTMGCQKASELLEDVAIQGKRIFEPMELFGKERPPYISSKRKVPHYCTYIRSAMVTPTALYFNSPTVEISNRVIRQYSTYADRFLRVRFTDEKPKARLYSNAKNGGKTTMADVYARIKSTMMNGITLGDRHYQFLAFGNSQFRENGAYFFSPVDHLSPARIRSWMGDFSDIKQVSRYAARLGQCFSTTRAIHGARAMLGEIPDITSADGKYNFTDGVGRISKTLAQLAATELGIITPDNEPPSVLQFRLGGCKGVLTVWNRSEALKVYIRPSQYKFHAQYEGLEVVRWSQFSASHLNRQLVSVLSALGVPDEIFTDKMRQQLSSLDEAMTDEKVALRILQKEVDFNQMSLTLAAMVLDGFQRTREPFMASVLRLWRAFSIKYLKEKAKIVIPKGAVLLGCVDETKVLKGHYNHLQPKSPDPTPEKLFKSVPEIFVQISKGKDDIPEIMEGYMILARNPSLHPGDIRVVRGVDRPQLRHLKDVVVLPQTGDRDIASMCSGGDLDGDDYVVIWDQELIPQEWNHEPMDFTPDPPATVTSKVTIDEITSFFVSYMMNDSLGSIATAHLGMADYHADGVKNPKCLELARLHSQAVDYAKSGQNAQMTPELVPRKWPHFMEKRPEVTYKSTKILGKLYDLVERVDFVPEYDSPFDQRILSQYDLPQKLRETVVEVKARYDAALGRIMTQHAISTEFEVWSTFVMSHTQQGSDFKFHEIIGQLSASLKETYRTECYELAGGRDFEMIGPFVAAMYKITYEEVQRASRGDRQGSPSQMGLSASKVEEKDNMPMISFPWLFASVLGKIARGNLKSLSFSTTLETHDIASTEPRRHPKKVYVPEIEGSRLDVLRTKEGETHRGEILSLFQDDKPLQVSNKAKLIDFGDDSHQPSSPSTGSLVSQGQRDLQDLTSSELLSLPYRSFPNSSDIDLDAGFLRGGKPFGNSARVADETPPGGMEFPGFTRIDEGNEGGSPDEGELLQEVSLPGEEKLSPLEKLEMMLNGVDAKRAVQM